MRIRAIIGFITLGVIMILIFSLRKNDESTLQPQREMRSRLESAIANIDWQLARLKKEGETSSDGRRKKIDVQIALLEETRTDLAPNLDKVETTSPDMWDQFQLSVNLSLEKARRILEEVTSLGGSI